MSLALTFVGHQTWLLSTGKTNILVDPILESTYGNSVEMTFPMPVYPPRTVKFDQLPNIDAVIISHEHIDHFHLGTLARLKRSTRILVGELMLESVVYGIRGLGFQVERLSLEKVHTLGGFKFKLYGATQADLGYERRVTQMHFWEAKNPENTVYNSVDCLLSPLVAADVEAGTVPAPRNVILSNNGMLPYTGGRRAYYNISDRTADTRSGIESMRSMLETVKEFPDVERVFIMGNGLLPFNGEYGPFIWSDNKDLANMVNEISTGPRLFGPYPGDRYRIDGDTFRTDTAPWIDFDEPAMRRWERVGEETENKASKEELPVLTRPFASDEAARQGQKVVEEELRRMAPVLLATDFGSSLQVIDDPNYPDLDARRLVIRFQGGPGGKAVQYALDIKAATFVPDDTPREALVATFPHGLEMQLCDFLAITQGRLLIWDIFFVPVRCWYTETLAFKAFNFLTALGSVYGEQGRPDLAMSVNELAVRHYSRL